MLFYVQCQLSPALEAEGRLRAREPRDADLSKLERGRAAPPLVVRAVAQVVLLEEGGHHGGIDDELEDKPMSLLRRRFNALDCHPIERRLDGGVWRVPDRNESTGREHIDGQLALKLNILGVACIERDESNNATHLDF